MEFLWTLYRHISPSGKVYVGITHYEDPNDRWLNGKGYNKCPFFFPAILKYGWNNIKHEVLATGLTREQACREERRLIKYYKERKLSYNSADGGVGHTGSFSEAHKKRISESSRSHEPEIRNKISQALKAKHLIPWNKGKTGIYTDEARQRISEAQRGRISPTKGKKVGPMSEETKAKISAANKGKNTWSKGSKRGPYSKEHCIKISEGLKGIRKGISTGPRSEETKAKISNTRRGYKWISKPWEPPKQVSLTEYKSYINSGWKPGKLIIHNNEVYKWDKQSSSWQIYEQARKSVLLKKKL